MILCSACDENGTVNKLRYCFVLNLALLPFRKMVFNLYIFLNVFRFKKKKINWKFRTDIGA